MTTTTSPYTKEGNAEFHARAEFARIVGGEYKTTASVNWAVAAMDRHLTEAGKTRADLGDTNKRSSASEQIASAVETANLAGARAAFAELIDGKCKSPVAARIALRELHDSLQAAKRRLRAVGEPGQRGKRVANRIRHALYQVPDIRSDQFCHNFLMGRSRLL